MKSIGNRLVTLVAIIFAATGLLFIACDDDDSPTDSSNTPPRVRVIHASQANGAVDVDVDDSTIIDGLTYGEASEYAQYSEGSRQIEVTPDGSDTPVLISELITLESDLEYTLFAVNTGTQIEEIHTADDRTVVVGQAKVRFVHAIPDGGTYDIKVDTGFGVPEVEYNDVTFRDISSYHQLNGTDYSFVISSPNQNDTLFSYDPVTLDRGKIYTVIVYGTIDAGDVWPVNLRVFEDDNTGTIYVDPAENP